MADKVADKLKKQIEVNLRFNEIKLLGFQISDYGNSLEKPIDSDKFEFQFQLTTNLELESKKFKTLLDVGCFDKSNPQMPKLASMKCTFELILINLEDIAITKNGVVGVPDPVLRLAFSSAISTARGIFMMCSAPTKFSNAIIPLINVDQFNVENVPPSV